MRCWTYFCVWVNTPPLVSTRLHSPVLASTSQNYSFSTCIHLASRLWTPSLAYACLHSLSLNSFPFILLCSFPFAFNRLHSLPCVFLSCFFPPQLASALILPYVKWRLLFRGLAMQIWRVFFWKMGAVFDVFAIKGCIAGRKGYRRRIDEKRAYGVDSDV